MGDASFSTRDPSRSPRAAARATEAGEAFRDLSAGAPRRLVLISSRMYFADVLMECVEAGVEAVYFDWRFSSLEKIAAECRDRCGGDLATLRSIGIMTHHKPGAIGLVKGLRTTRRNLVRPELRQFWASMAQLLHRGWPRRRLVLRLCELRAHAAAARGARRPDPRAGEHRRRRRGVPGREPRRRGGGPRGRGRLRGGFAVF